jgi:hypothetical protein
VATRMGAVGAHVPAGVTVIPPEDVERDWVEVVEVELVEVVERDWVELAEPRVLTRRAMAPASAITATTRMTISMVAAVLLAGLPPALPSGVTGRPPWSPSILQAFRGNPS